MSGDKKKTVPFAFEGSERWASMDNCKGSISLWSLDLFCVKTGAHIFYHNYNDDHNLIVTRAENEDDRIAVARGTNSYFRSQMRRVLVWKPFVGPELEKFNEAVQEDLRLPVGELLPNASRVLADIVNKYYPQGFEEKP